MNDFYAYVREQKSLVPSARRRKCGSKSRSCTLPSDHMTMKQWKERNGKMVVFNLGKPTSWAEFTAVSKETQKMYIQKLRDTYDVRPANIADMLGISYSSFHRVAKDLGVDFNTGRIKKDKEVAWKAFLTGSHETIEQPVPQDEPQKEEAVPGQKERAKMQMGMFSLRFDGQIDIENIMQSVRFMVGDDNYGTMEVTWYKCDKGDGSERG